MVTLTIANRASTRYNTLPLLSFYRIDAYGETYLTGDQREEGVHHTELLVVQIGEDPDVVA